MQPFHTSGYLFSLSQSFVFSELLRSSIPLLIFGGGGGIVTAHDTNIPNLSSDIAMFSVFSLMRNTTLTLDHGQGDIFMELS